MYRLAADNIFGSCNNLGENLNALGADIGGLFIPGATGLGLGVRAANRTVKNGDIVFKEFQTSKGVVEILAEARVKGDVLKLKDIAVFPKGAKNFDIGPREVLQIRKQLADTAAEQGFRRLRITGKRISGANPGKKVNVKIDLD